MGLKPPLKWCDGMQSAEMDPRCQGHPGVQAELIDHVRRYALACKGRQEFVPYCLLQWFQKIVDIMCSSGKISPLTCETMCEGRISGVWLAGCKR